MSISETSRPSSPKLAISTVIGGVTFLTCYAIGWLAKGNLQRYALAGAALGTGLGLAMYCRWNRRAGDSDAETSSAAVRIRISFPQESESARLATTDQADNNSSRGAITDSLLEPSPASFSVCTSPTAAVSNSELDSTSLDPFAEQTLSQTITTREGSFHQEITQLTLCDSELVNFDWSAISPDVAKFSFTGEVIPEDIFAQLPEGIWHIELLNCDLRGVDFSQVPLEQLKSLDLAKSRLPGNLFAVMPKTCAEEDPQPAIITYAQSPPNLIDDYSSGLLVVLSGCDLRPIDLKDVPYGIQRLALSRCQFSERPFKELPRWVNYIDLSGSSSLYTSNNESVLQGLPTHFAGTLNLSGCPVDNQILESLKNQYNEKLRRQETTVQGLILRDTDLSSITKIPEGVGELDLGGHVLDDADLYKLPWSVRRLVLTSWAYLFTGPSILLKHGFCRDPSYSGGGNIHLTFNADLYPRSWIVSMDS